MRTLFLGLLSANLLFLAWAHWVDTPRNASAPDTLSRLPRLQLVNETTSGAQPPAATIQKMSLREPAGGGAQSCTSVGPFSDMASAARTAGILLEHGFNPQDRAEKGETLEGYWVYVGGMQSDADLAQVVDRLEKSGFADAHVMKPTAEGRRVSVGLFSKRERAERRALAVRHMGLEPQISERKFPGTVYWVDVATPAGGAGLPAEALMADTGAPKLAVDPCPASVQLPGAPDEAPSATGSEPAGEGPVTVLPRTTVASAPKPP
ncbi:MAG TPA: SPOR domain-containing protein [Steroidobacteraceae bacterium]